MHVIFLRQLYYHKRCLSQKVLQLNKPLLFKEPFQNSQCEKCIFLLFHAQKVSLFLQQKEFVQQELFCQSTKEYLSSVPPLIPFQLPQTLFNMNKLPAKCQARLGERASNSLTIIKKNNQTPTRAVELCIQILMQELFYVLLVLWQNMNTFLTSASTLNNS